MAGPGFVIALEPEIGLMRVKLSGFWTRATLADYRAAQMSALTELRRVDCKPGELLVLADSLDYEVQSQDMVNEFSKLSEDLSHVARRVAIVTTSALQERQVRRASTFDGIRLFSAVADAETWLSS